MEEEVWRDIKGYEGLYQVSNLGNVKRLSTIKTDSIKRLVHRKTIILAKRLSTNQYYNVFLFKNGKGRNHMIHKLVADNFIGCDIPKITVNHKDGNKFNNNLSNLEYLSKGDNQRHAYRIGLKVACKPMLGKLGSLHHTSRAIIRYDLNGNIIKEYGSILEASRDTGIIHQNIQYAAKRCKSHIHNGNIWIYKEQLKEAI